jgi:CDP-glycerol glycerophosphotransferase
MKKEDNQNKYNKKRARILLKGFIPSFIGIFIPKNNKRIIFNSTRNEFFNFNTKYLFEYFIKYHPEYECKYIINDKNKRDNLNKKFGEENNYFIEAESLKNIWYILRAKAWILSALETPVGGFFLKKNRFVFHVGHGAYFRSALFIENKLPWKKRLYYHLIKNNFSHHLITSETIAKIAPKMFGCKKEQIVILGDPMSDMVYTPNKDLIKKIFGENVFLEKNILYMPTWRQDGSLKLFPFDDLDFDDLVNFLEENKVNIYLRMHPSYEDDLTFYTDLSSRFKIIDTSKVEDINETIGFFDLVITDYSSGHIGYMLTKKPLLFLPYDIDSYEDRMGFVVPYDRSTPGPKPTTLKEFKVEIKRLLTEVDYYLEDRKKAIKIFNKYEKDNTKMVAEFIIKNLGEDIK